MKLFILPNKMLFHCFNQFLVKRRRMRNSTLCEDEQKESMNAFMWLILIMCWSASNMAQLKWPRYLGYIFFFYHTDSHTHTHTHTHKDVNTLSLTDNYEELTAKNNDNSW